MSKLFVISELFYPEETSTAFVMTQIVNQLADKYKTVEVICGHPVYDKTRYNSSHYSLNEKVKIRRIKAIGSSKNNLITRSLRFISLSLFMFFALLKRVRRGDSVVLVTNPAPIIILGSLAKWIKGFRLIILVHDVFPENTIPGGIFKDNQSFIYKFLCNIFNKAYAYSDKLIVVGRDMERVMKRKTLYNKNLEIKVIENWSENKIITPQTDITPKNKIILQFAGNLGRVQGLMDLLHIIKQTNNNILEWHFVGEGAMKKELMEFARRNNMQNVKFRDGYKREEQVNILNNADISIVTLSKGMFGLGVPSKSYNILAAGKPILYIGDRESEIDLMIREHKVGYSFHETSNLLSFCNSIQISDKHILKEMGLRARHLAESIYSEDNILKKYIKEI